MFPLTSHKDRIALIVAFAALIAQPAVKAQGLGTSVVANIPFAFQIGSEQLPAGTYTIELQGSDFLWVKGNAGSGVMIVMKESANRPSPDSAVVFHHYGNQYFLREVRTAGSGDRVWTNETKAEHRAKLELAAANPNSGPREDSKVEVALLAPPR
jgi:hypothetical protein